MINELGVLNLQSKYDKRCLCHLLWAPVARRPHLLVVVVVHLVELDLVVAIPVVARYLFVIVGRLLSIATMEICSDLYLGH